MCLLLFRFEFRPTVGHWTGIRRNDWCEMNVMTNAAMSGTAKAPSRSRRSRGCRRRLLASNGVFNRHSGMTLSLTIALPAAAVPPVSRKAVRPVVSVFIRRDFCPGHVADPKPAAAELPAPTRPCGGGPSFLGSHHPNFPRHYPPRPCRGSQTRRSRSTVCPQSCCGGMLFSAILWPPP